ncbi:hypothetical protein IH575_01560 [Candidatus Dojkabacteria bacterium]|nr:hypothetical protein [Candidatus Dojkabacteria bacterium]
MSRRFLAFLITIFIIVLLALVGVGITYVLRVTGIDSEIKTFLERDSTVSYTTVVTRVSSPVADLDKIPDKLEDKDIETISLTSDVLKLSFNYQRNVGGYDVGTSRVGNKLSVRAANQTTEDAQYIELFSKKPEESFADAVRRIFLAGVPETFCYFKEEASGFTFENSGFVSGSLEAGTGVRPEQCPGPYTKNTAEGKRFFIYNPATPDRFGFVFVGNTFVPGSTVRTHWFESLQFLP